MWLPTPSVDSITRPRLAVAVVAAFSAASIGYYAYQSGRTQSELLTGQGLHRSNAVRRLRRVRNEIGSSSSSEAPGDENAVFTPLDLENQGDGETVIDGDADEWWNNPTGFPSSQRAGHNIVNLLFRVSEDNARRNGCVHRGCQCNACGMVPIRGVRYRCANCADFDLCETCETQGVHHKTHVFYKIKVPAPPFAPRQTQMVWYTGDPDTSRRNLPRALILKLTKLTGFERPELEAFWEQWTFMANTEWRDDPDDLCLAMDRKTFERCLVPTGGLRHAAPNLIHDRMFSFYDSNHDDLIDFTEFLQGLSFRKRKDRLRKVFEGYDIDADEYVDRRDFLRMFRAYYVLYKQMHKDILDGLEDQLLSSTEAQQLVASRQPLSSLFGRDGRIPDGDAGLGSRLDGKTYQQDGSVEIAQGHESAVAEDRGDTATRQEVLTNLFAYETDQRSRRRFVTGSDADNNWRIVRRLSGNENNPTYWVTLLEPPSSLEQLPELIIGDRNLQAQEYEEYTSVESSENEDDEDDENDPVEQQPESGPFSASLPTESSARASLIAHNRRQIPKMEKRRRDMARAQLHDRWKRRQFYLDEEEGGVAPEDWDNDEDTLANLREMAESSEAAEHDSATRSRSDSKVRFAEDFDDLDTRSNPSSASRSIPERFSGTQLPFAERDAGKEILYQVTQQAFNELLDILFKAAEDVAIQAAETREDREKYKDLIANVELEDERSAEETLMEDTSMEEADVGDKSLDELLSDAGYSLEEPRNAVDLGSAAVEITDEDDDDKMSPVKPDPAEQQDPTMPQFRPTHSSDDGLFVTDPTYPITNVTSASSAPPSHEQLQIWKRLDVAEKEAARRGGWGKLNYEEFESIYKSQEDHGNRLDYLGSWIDFCIP